MSTLANRIIGTNQRNESARGSDRGRWVHRGLFFEQALNIGGEFLAELNVIDPAAGGGETGMRRLHLAVPANKQSGGPGIQVHRLRHLVPHLARATSGRYAVNMPVRCPALRLTSRLPSACGVSTIRPGREPSKWLATNLPSCQPPVSAPVSPSTRRMVVVISAPFWLTIRRQAFSPLGDSVGISQTPSMEGALGARAVAGGT